MYFFLAVLGLPYCESFSLVATSQELLSPLQCSCLEKPRDGGAWWAAVHGVAQSRTRLKQLSSSRSYSLIAVHGLLIAVASLMAHRLYSTDSAVVIHQFSCTSACRIFPDQGSNPCLLNRQVDSLPLSRQGSPRNVKGSSLGISLEAFLDLFFLSSPETASWGAALPVSQADSGRKRERKHRFGRMTSPVYLISSGFLFEAFSFLLFVLLRTSFKKKFKTQLYSDFLKKYLCIYLTAVGLSCGIQDLSCSMWDLVPWSGVESRPLALGVQSLSHWTTGKVPKNNYWNIHLIEFTYLKCTF